ncbi:MAG: hypothetical protein AB2A00_08940 [Myxococcota bacterium]
MSVLAGHASHAHAQAAAPPPEQPAPTPEPPVVETPPEQPATPEQPASPPADDTEELPSLGVPEEPAPPRREEPPVSVPPPPSLWDTELKPVATFTLVPVVAGMLGMLSGALAGAVLSAALVIPSALMVRFATPSREISTTGIFTFFAAPPVCAWAGAMAGYLVARAVGAAMTPVQLPDRASRGARVATFAATDLLAHLVVFIPLVALTVAFGAAMGWTSGALSSASQPFFVVGQPTPRQIMFVTGAFYTLLAAMVVWPAAAAVVQLITPVASLVLSGVVAEGGAP